MVTAVTGTSFTVAPSTTTTAMLRALGAQVSAAIASAGMVKTTDTGQVDWTAVTWLTGIRDWGYEIWRFNDTLQATKPVFIKLIYGQGSSVNSLSITAQVGTATDGAGTLTSAPNTGVSVTAVNIVCSSSGSPATAVSPWHVYGDGSSLVIASVIDKWTGTGGSGIGGLFHIERARHIDGTPLSDGMSVTWVSAQSTTVISQSLLHGNTYAQLGSQSSGQIPSQGTTHTSGVVGANMFTLPWFTGMTPRLGAPSTMLLGFYRNDMAVGATFACDHYGAARTFVALSTNPATTPYNFGFASTGNTLAPAVRIS